MSGGGRWVQTQLVYKSASPKPLRAKAANGPRASFELVISKQSPSLLPF